MKQTSKNNELSALVTSGNLINTSTRQPRSFMAVNVILTFLTSDYAEDPQEVFDLKLPVSRNESNVFEFLNKKFFPRIVSKCHKLKLKRDPRTLVKISTCSDWDLFERTTQKPAFSSFGHPCKWHFGQGRNDLDSWEKWLVKEFSFGVDADMSWVEKVSRAPNLVPELELVI